MKGIQSFCLTVLEIAQFLVFASVASYWAVFILYPETKRRYDSERAAFTYQPLSARLLFPWAAHIGIGYRG